MSLITINTQKYTTKVFILYVSLLLTAGIKLYRLQSSIQSSIGIMMIFPYFFNIFLSWNKKVHACQIVYTTKLLSIDTILPLEENKDIKDLLVKKETSRDLSLVKVSGSESWWFDRWGGKEGRPGGRRRCQWGQTWRTDHSWWIDGSLDTALSAGALRRRPTHPAPEATARTSPPHTAGTDLVRRRAAQVEMRDTSGLIFGGQGSQTKKSFYIVLYFIYILHV